jgi:hypothetical protein
VVEDRRVADEDTHAIDPQGIRRWVAKGFEVPPGWEWEDELEQQAEQPKPKPKPKPKDGRRKKRAA